jgi:hypothetical protein
MNRENRIGPTNGWQRNARAGKRTTGSMPFRADRGQYQAQNRSRLPDLIAAAPGVVVLADFRATTGTLIITCPMARPGEAGHKCVIFPAAPGNTAMTCIHPSCWKHSRSTFLAAIARSARQSAPPACPDALSRPQGLNAVRPDQTSHTETFHTSHQDMEHVNFRQSTDAHALH